MFPMSLHVGSVSGEGVVIFPNPLVLEVKWVSETEQVNPLLLSPELSFFLPQCALSPRKVQVVHADLVPRIILEA